MTTTDANKKLVTELIDGLFTRGDPATAAALPSDDFVNHDPPFGVTPDREGMRDAVTFRAAFLDWPSEPHRLVAEDDIVADHHVRPPPARG